MGSVVKEMLPPGLRKELKIRRAQAFERLGSQRYSRPGLGGMDGKLERYLDFMDGRFLEIGANDGFSQSNTYYLERFRGWSGILIEPLPNLHRRCAKLRTRSTCINVACVGRAGPAQLDMMDFDLMSIALGQQDQSEESARLKGKARRVRVPTSTLSAVLRQYGDGRPVDFISLDVEGAELQVLDGLRLAEHTPSFMLVETRFPEQVAATVSSMELVDQLSHHDYLFRAVPGQG